MDVQQGLYDDTTPGFTYIWVENWRRGSRFTMTNDFLPPGTKVKRYENPVTAAGEIIHAGKTWYFFRIHSIRICTNVTLGGGWWPVCPAPKEPTPTPKPTPKPTPTPCATPTPQPLPHGEEGPGLEGLPGPEQPRNQRVQQTAYGVGLDGGARTVGGLTQRDSQIVAFVSVNYKRNPRPQPTPKATPKPRPTPRPKPKPTPTPPPTTPKPDRPPGQTGPGNGLTDGPLPGPTTPGQPTNPATQGNDRPKTMGPP